MPEATDGRRLAPGGEPVYGLSSGDTEQKKSLVEGLQARGHKVAMMTGDGVNDILALKTADCSIAMESGNDATKKDGASGSTDSDFGKMPSIVAEGRRVVNNIQRSASLFLIKNIFSILLAISVTLFSLYLSHYAVADVFDQWFYNWDPRILPSA